MSSKLDLQQLISSLNKAVSTSLDFLEKQHVDNLLKYFDKYGNPITSDFKVGDEVMRVPLFCLSNHQSLQNIRKNHILLFLSNRIITRWDYRVLRQICCRC